MRLGKLSFCILSGLLMVFFASVAAAHGAMVEAGDEGRYVEEVQTLLKEKGYYKAEIHGRCDEATVEAIKAFQRAHHLDADGIAGPMTMRKLRPVAHRHDLSHARVVTVNAYAYSPQDPGMGKYTASGTPLRRGVIAVDPNYIPIGTNVYIPDYGDAVAEDIGWNIQGNTIDIAFDTHEEALYFGRQVLEIYILD
ncbi:MAG: peptidoglycan-binding protein [Selenomonadaceae bacterium]|nr:peptidoglycan-binding protein [Selenomonadaceae bacterium]MBQ5921067.1 peptidoglycan-binding protein [Selenomonadaceae bacterium]